MLEDIRTTHSPMPTAQEAEWMAARPGRATLYVSMLGIVAFAIAHLVINVDASFARPNLAALAPSVSGGGK